MNMICVCDGLGSRGNAKLGARQACRAVTEAAARWLRASGQSPSPLVLLRLVHLYWGLNVLPAAEDDSATTCLFAISTAEHKLLIATIGDGVSAIRTRDGYSQVLGAERETFTNETTGLGLARSTMEWTVSARAHFAPGDCVLLATDGVADDLRPGCIGLLMGHLIDLLGPMHPRARAKALRHELLNWPTPGHQDDKTIAMMWVPQR
jgi:serine/threonine protein phosphatase PrpC